MQILIWIVRVIVVLLFVWFAAKNAEPVVLYGYLDSSLKAPLALFLLAFFGGGLLLGLLASLPSIFRLKREVRKLNRALQQKAREADAALSAPAVGTADATPHSRRGDG
jgi:putative membrane protein